MAAHAISISSPLRISTPLRSVAFHSHRAPNVSFYSHLRPSFPFPTFFLKPLRTSRFRPPTTLSAALKSLPDTEMVAVPTDPKEVPTKFPPLSGVYAVYDSNNDLQFIGISRNIAVSIAGHRNSLSDLCCSVKVGVIEEPDRAALTQAWKSWMEEHIRTTGSVPPGNETGNSTWVPARQQARREKPDLRLTPGRHVQLTVPLEDLINRLVKENKVVAFIKGSRSAPLCGFSQRVVGILESEGIDYESVDVLDEEYNYGLRETLKRYSNWPTFPQIFVNGGLVGGCDILTSMYEKGELADLLKK